MDVISSADDLRRRARSLPPDLPVEIAARRLRHMNWVPELLVQVADFERIGREDLIREVDEVLSMSDAETRHRIGTTVLVPARARLVQASMMVNAAELLWRLRSDEPEAWDEVYELYEDD